MAQNVQSIPALQYRECNHARMRAQFSWMQSSYVPSSFRHLLFSVPLPLDIFQGLCFCDWAKSRTGAVGAPE